MTRAAIIFSFVYFLGTLLLPLFGVHVSTTISKKEKISLPVFFFHTLKKNPFSSLFVISIPIISILFIDSFPIILWIYPMLIVSGSLLLDKQTLLFSAAFVSTMTKLWIWMFKEQNHALISLNDILLRLVFLLVVYMLGMYMNKAYLKKVKENNFLNASLALLSSISTGLLMFNEEKFYENIQDLLQKIGLFFGADRAYLFTINHTDNTMTYSNEWCKIGVDPGINTIGKIPLDTFPWWIDQFTHHQFIEIKDVATMPPEAKAEQDQLHKQGTKSLVFVPIMDKKTLHAFIGIDFVQDYQELTTKQIQVLHTIAHILTPVLTPIQIDKQIKFMAYNDALTKLPNRFLFVSRINQAIQASQQTGKIFAVLFIDLDGFKCVNDKLGHVAGDDLLQQVAHKLKAAVRQADTVARFGGDEFLIVVNDIDRLKTCTQMTKDILDVFSAPFTVDNHPFMITASIGITLYPEHGENPKTLIQHADTAMYQAKLQGKNKYVIYTPDMHVSDCTHKN